MDDSLGGAGDPYWTSFFDNFEKNLGKKKLSEEDDGKRRKKLRVDDQPDTLMAEARPKLRAGTQLVEIPEFLGDYVEDMLGCVDLRAHAEGELEGELDMLVKGAKSSMMLAGLKNHTVINKMVKRIKVLESEAIVVQKELQVMKARMDIRQKYLVEEQQNLAECKRNLEEKEERISQLGDLLEAKTKECQREATKRKALETKVEELGAMVHASRYRILRDFQNSQEYKDVLGVNHLEGLY